MSTNLMAQFFILILLLFLTPVLFPNWPSAWVIDVLVLIGALINLPKDDFGILLSILDIVFGVIFVPVGVIVALWYEAQGHPRLDIVADEESDAMRAAGWRARFLKVRVTNRPRKGWLWTLVNRETAVSCFGSVSFFLPSSEQIGQTLPIRWDAAPEPFKFEFQNGRLVSVLEPSLVGAGRTIDIPADAAEGIAIAVRIHGDEEAYGWSIDNYGFDHWRHPLCRLPIGEYTAQVKVRSADKTAEKEFMVINPEEYERFRIEA